MDFGQMDASSEAFGEGGWNLIELMVALVIISVGLLGTAALLTGTIQGNQTSKNVTIATILAKDKMEDLSSKPYSTLPSEDTTDTEDYGTITDYEAYKRVTKTYVDDPDVNMKRVVVEVYYPGGSQPVTIPMIFEK